jgi:hypothetical protein
MKNIIVLLITGSLLFLGACNEDEFLNRFPKDSPNPGNFFVNEQTARMAVNAAWNPWPKTMNMLSRDMGFVIDAMSDDSYIRPAQAYNNTMVAWNYDPAHQLVRVWWTQPYTSINAANFAIDNIPLSKDPNFTPEKQAPYIAEAKWYRAFSYLFLATFYGDIPLYLDAASDFSEYYKPRTPKADIYEQVIQDFTDAKADLPPVQTNAKGAPTKATAAAFLAKAYLFTEQWPEAETAARDAITIAESSGYRMLDVYLNCWKVEQNEELLFYWGYVPNDDSYSNNWNVKRNCRDLPATLRIAINGDGWGSALPNRDLFDEYEPDDPRREYTIYYPGSDYEIYPGPNDFPYTHETLDSNGDKVTWDVVYKAGDMVKYDYRWSPNGMNVRKMTGSVAGLARVEWSGLDLPVMRMSELYLILAEALAEQGDPEALTWVNKVRKRADVNLPDRTVGDGRKGDTDLVSIVRHERRVELAMEHLRLIDLVRWGIIDDVFGDGKKVKKHFFSDFYAAGSSQKYSTPANLNFLTKAPIFPTPQYEIDNNPNIIQSTGW